MSTRDTIVLTPSDLRYLLLDSLRLYSSNVAFLGGSNPYYIGVNKKSFVLLIKNVHESGFGRANPDECRVQISRSAGLSNVGGNRLVNVLGYFPDEKVFSAWDPYLMAPRLNQRSTVSLYSRFSVMKRAALQGIALYIDSFSQRVPSFKPEYLGLYLDNVENIHRLDESQLLGLVDESDRQFYEGKDEGVQIGQYRLEITHERTKRDPKFRKLVYEAYGHRCAMCGLQLELIEAAHIVPHKHEHSSDDVINGVCLCSLHHNAYDQSLIYFNETYKVFINNEKIRYLEKLGYDGGYRKLVDLTFPDLIVPKSHASRPHPRNIKKANDIRGIPDLLENS